MIFPESIVFNASNMIVIKDFSTKQCQFITRENKLKNITTIYATQKKKGQIIIAVGESSLPTLQNDDSPATVMVTATDMPNKWNIMSQG